MGVHTEGNAGARGEVSTLRIPAGQFGPETSVPMRTLGMRDIIRHGLPSRDLSPFVNEYRFHNSRNLWRGAKKVVLAQSLNLATFYGALSASIGRCHCGDGLRRHPGKPCPEAEWIDLGLVSLRVVTTVGVGYIVDAFQNSVEMEDMKYHGIGTGGTAENVSDTDLISELTTQYSTNSTRATGSTTEGASANIYRTVGTNTVDAGVSIVEHAVFSNATVGSGVMIDRTVISSVALSASDSLQTTYDLTFTAGS